MTDQNTPRWYAGDLPTLTEIRDRAYREIGDAEDTLRSDWAPGAGPANRDQAAALHEARSHLAAAKAALNRAAQ